MTDNQPERWLPVVGSEGSYEVSSLGRVRSLDREVFVPYGAGYYRTCRGQLLVGRLDLHGYRLVHLDMTRRNAKVHQLVCEAFHGPRPPGQVVRHLNDVHDDNRAENLSWGTHAENNQDCIANGGHRKASQVRCHRGHLLQEPNLRVSSWVASGRRDCLACQRTYSVQRNRRRYQNEEIDYQAESDRQYDRIMGDLPR